MHWVLPLRSDALTAIAEAVAWLGSYPFFLIVLMLGYWFQDRDRFTRIAVIIVFMAVVNGWLKNIWQDPRPDSKYRVDDDYTSSYGRPAGRVQTVAAVWFWIAYETRLPLAWIAAALIVAGVGLSRLYLGAHDLDDVLTGAAVGFVSLYLFHWLLSPRFDFFRAWPVAAHLALMAACGLAMTYTWPTGDSPVPTIAKLALLFGWIGGAAIDRKLAPAPPRRPAWLLCFLAGAAGVVVFFLLQAALRNTVQAIGIEGVATRYLISAVLGFYMTALAPWTFRVLRVVK
ncbi:MAG: phosphatase PAP2 family protein [Parvibaculum sp.]|uniref:phosphatase PAP2 family protein n=1 Tax=Parvibaculum sp. TaxID=2024848 RepID=UPI0025F32923|nr:phosphatase PAP2 family protein [Parvibaculum sp.]MCE9648987.1 phosphatase PAP2 family protein [Parvibaculum sp.]